MQAFVHHTSTADDPHLFRQSNGGAEVVSGNRNWTMIAGGTPVGPGDPGTPQQQSSGLNWAGAGAGALAGAAIGPGGAVIGAIAGFFGSKAAGQATARSTQADRLLADQSAMVRETILIPTPVGIDRSHTIRFAQPFVSEARNTRASRLCVAEGFMCGFDLRMPSHPFPTDAQHACPFPLSLPQPLDTRYYSGGLRLQAALGCLVKTPGNVRGWGVWTFNRGMLGYVADPVPGREKMVAAWVEDIDHEKRHVHVEWTIPGFSNDWYNVYPYNIQVEDSAAAGEAPAGALDYKTFGDPLNTNTFDYGKVEFDASKSDDSTWYILVQACNPTYGFLGIRTGHACHGNVLPRIEINVARVPEQPFSCNANGYHEDAVVLEVGGSCSKSPYGLFVYVWSRPCRFEDECPEDASDFGFVVTAPSRGWSWDEFAQIVNQSMIDFRVKVGHDYRPDGNVSSVAVPISPPVRKENDKWLQTSPASSHVVQFRWRLPSFYDAAILDDTGAGVFTSLSQSSSSWPTAVGHVTVPGVSLATDELVHSDGKGCFTVAGKPTAANPDPAGLIVDLRDAPAAAVTEVRSSELAGAC